MAALAIKNLQENRHKQNGGPKSARKSGPCGRQVIVQKIVTNPLELPGARWCEILTSEFTMT